MILDRKQPSFIESGLCIGRAEVLPDPDPFVVLSQHLATNRIPVFRNDTDKPIDVFRVIAHQLRKFLHLRFQPFQPEEGVL